MIKKSGNQENKNQGNQENPAEIKVQTKAGYKKTEIGVIPVDWKECTFQDVLMGFSSGMTPYRGIPEYYTGSIPWITSGELNYNIILDTIEKINEDAVIKTNLKVLPVGTFLMAITGLEAAGTRGSCAITGVKATTNQSCMALFPQKGKITTEYLYQFYMRYGNELAFKFCQGTKQQSYTGKIAKILPINVPPNIVEQTAIATVLSDTDKLIQTLEKQIAKKRLIKQGAMQKLLKPKEGWEVKTIAELINENYIIGHLDGNHGELYPRSHEFSTSGIPYIGANDFQKGRVLFSNCKYLPIERALIFKKGIAKNGDVLFAHNATVGPTAMLTTHHDIVILSTTATYFRCNNEKLLNTFLFFSLQSGFFVKQYKSVMSQSTRSQVPITTQKKFSIKYPNINEQTRITQILSDMVNEIETLENKLAKYTAIKQGLMQNLLTGKIRLV